MNYGDIVGSLRQQIVSSRENKIILGTLLGDGHLAKLKTGVRLEVGHSAKQKLYTFWKYNELKKFMIAKPHLITIKDSRYQKIYYQWRFKTQINPLFALWHTYFYDDRKRKRIGGDIITILNSPLALAVWYMDDGGRRNDSYGIFFNTLSFTLEEQKILRACLRENFSLDARIHWVQDGYRLYIPSKEIKRFCTLVHPYIIPSMRYKLPYNPVTTSFARLNRARDRVLIKTL